MTGRGGDSLLLGFARPTPGGKARHGLAAEQMPFYDLGNVALVEAEVPGAFRVRPVVDDDVGAVLAQAEAVDGVDADVVEEARSGRKRRSTSAAPT